MPAPAKRTKIPTWAWIALGAVVLVGVVLWERRKQAQADAEANLTPVVDQPPSLLDYGASPSGANGGTGVGGGAGIPGVTPDPPLPPELVIPGFGYGPYFKGPYNTQTSNYGSPGIFGFTGTAATGVAGVAPKPVYTTPGQGPGMGLP